MSIQTWPSSLPDPLTAADVTQLNGLDNPKGQNDASQNRTRTNPEFELHCFFMCTLTQWRQFSTFYKTTLNEGLIPFSAPWLSTFYELSHHYARFKGAVTITKAGYNAFRIQAAFEITTMASANGVWVFDD